MKRLSICRLLLSLAASAFLVACEPADNAAQTSASKETAASSLVTVALSESTGDVEDESARLNAWFEEQYEDELAFSPIQQTLLGVTENNDQIDNFSLEAQIEQLDWKRDTVAEMRASFDYEQLNADSKISYDLWEYQLAATEAANQFRINGYVFEQMNAIHSFFPQLLIAFHTVEDADDMQAYVSRIEATEVALGQLITLSREAAAAGVRPPRFAFESVIDSARQIITGAPFTEGEDSAIWADTQQKIATLQEAETINQVQADALANAARAALADHWQPAYERLIAWQQEDMVNTSETSQGVGALPDGEAYYNERLANQTTTDLTADEIYQIGLDEVARLKAEMEVIKNSVGFEGDLKAFFAMLRDNKDDLRHYYPDSDEGRQLYIDDATAAIENIKAKLATYFGILPKADLKVRRVEPFREQPGAAQHYFPGTPDGSRPGIYYAHLSDMTAMPKGELEVIAYHEGLPGHHMQIAIQQELESVPTFRTQAGFTAYSEGWGLYSELLAKEMEGTYADPYSDFGRLGSEIWRAIRLVLDTGLHVKNWTEEQAVQYFLDNSAITEAQARSEVQRYMVLPGQATSYKIGMLKIQELREKAEQALGDKFDIRGFHDALLGGGAVPLSVLEIMVDQWIAQVQMG
ncbi:DUF885 domain-containing protein [bacterium]|nr:DUF885 domain-containing protein [bacterium]